MSKFACPVDPSHDRFAAEHCETVHELFAADGTFIEDISNTYDGKGYQGPLYCRVCDRAGVVTVIVDDANLVLT